MLSFQTFDFSLRDLFNALLNGNRGTQAPWPRDGIEQSSEARAMLGNGGPHVAASAPATLFKIVPVPQAFDFTHVAAMSRFLPALALESTSGGWVALPYAFDPPPEIPAIILPQAQWTTELGDPHLTGLESLPTPTGAIFSIEGAPTPGLGYPTQIATPSDVLMQQGM